ncbi:hypothetical protein ABT369_45670 [Dactylosporangium sp. NPDC000244]|uniref:hypothetical protein n=1 Tax=Dactylosporangium sp. NPDC000244 TaxID=3154365 RepID=UPI0033233D83
MTVPDLPPDYAGWAHVPAQPAATPVLPSAPIESEASRTLTRMAIGAAGVLVLALGTAIAVRPTDGSPAEAAWRPAGITLAECQARIANVLTGKETCDYPQEERDRAAAAPAADPKDPVYAGVVLAVGLQSDDRGGTTGANRPVVPTVYPVLSATLPAAPGVPHVDTAFQLQGLDGPIPQEGEQLGGDGNWPEHTTALPLERVAPLEHGVSYRWRVRATPPQVAAAGWSRWCEFTVARADLRLDEYHTYQVTLPAETWREILAVLGPAVERVNGYEPPHGPIESAVRDTSGSRSADQVAVAMNGRRWITVMDDLAQVATQRNTGAWPLADALSAGLGGPERVTMGFPRRA